MAKKDTCISIVVPALNEEENIAPLSQEINHSLSASYLVWECIWVDDGSDDRTWTEICKLGKPHRGIRLNHNYGQSTAIMAGIDESTYGLIVTLDADMQNDPADIPMLVENLTKDIDIVNGYRVNRKDSWLFRKFPSKCANWIARKLFNFESRDLGCTLRVFRKFLVSDLRIMGEMHRVLPIYFHFAGARSLEIPTTHRPRKFGTSKYGLARTLKFISDLLLAKFLSTLLSRPLYLFSKLSFFVFFFGMFNFVSAFLLILLGYKQHLDGSLINAGFTFLSLSLLLLGLGLIGEANLRLVARDNPRSQYAIREIS